MAYLKPDTPIRNVTDYIYPLTTMDQVMRPDTEEKLYKDGKVNLKAEDIQDFDDKIQEIVGGIGGVMHFIGPVEQIPPEPDTYKAGDVVTKDKKEYVKTTGSEWIELGDEGSFAVKGQIVNDDIAAEAAIETSKIDGLDDALATIPEAATEPPVDLAKAATVGVSDKYALEDHAHKMPTAEDVDAIPNTALSDELPKDLSAEAKAGESTDVARADHVHKLPTADDIQAVPTTRTINEKPLDNDISLTASDIGAVPNDWPTTESGKHLVVGENGKVTTVAASTPTDLLSYVSNYYNSKRTGKVYQTKLWKYSENPTPEGIKLLDNAGLVCEPSTDTQLGRDDYANGEHPLFDWMHVNYKRYDDGCAYPTALENSLEYKTSGEGIDVGSMMMSFYWNWKEESDHYLVTISDSPNTTYDLKPWPDCVRQDGTVMPWCIISSYFSGDGADGMQHSQPGLPLHNFISYNTVMTEYAKKGKGYFGAGSTRNTFQIVMNAIKYATKSSQTKFAGTTNYNWQYPAVVQRKETAKYITVTKAQADNIIIGSGVYVGYANALSGSSPNTDRGQATMRQYTPKICRVTDKKPNGDANVDVYVDTDPFQTANVVTGNVNSPVYISSMEWHSGETDKVLGKHDGSPVSNTDGKHPYRIQGVEYAVGAYFVASDTAMINQSDMSAKVYVAKRGVTRTNVDATIQSTYTEVGTIPANGDINDDWWIGDSVCDPVTGVYYPQTTNGSSAETGTGDRCYGGSTGANTGSREYLLCGDLGCTSRAGACDLSRWGALSNAYWLYAAAD